MAHHGLNSGNIKPRTKELSAKRCSEFVQKPVSALSRLFLAALTLAAVQADCHDLLLQGPQHVTIRFAVFAED